MGWMMGLEPTNAGTTNQCVNHFATPTIGISLIGAPGEIRTPDNLLRRQMLYPTELQAQFQGLRLSIRLPFNRGKLGKSWSGQRDSNPRPPAPKAGALAKLRYAPIGDLISIAHLFLFVKEKDQNNYGNSNIFLFMLKNYSSTQISTSGLPLRACRIGITLRNA